MKPPHRTGSTSVALPEGSAQIGRYRLIALLGQGGMARVYLALMTGPAGFNKLLVVKTMKEDLDDPVFLKSFMAEARLAAQLNHPNVVQTYEVGESEGAYFIAMEYLEGQSLRVVQRRLAPQRLPLPMQMRMLADVARGLHHAHTLKSFEGTPLDIVHRDVSPQNILLTYDGQVKLLDFGIAKASGGDDLTRAGMIKGKIDYMAPEQLRGDKVDPRADVFALGAMMWEAIAGTRFSGGAEVADATKIHNRIMGKERKLRDITPDAPMRLVEICDKALALDREDRQASAEAFAREVEDYLAGTSRTSDGRRLSDIMAPLFEHERAEIRAVIDEQVRIANDPNRREVPASLSSIPRVSAETRATLSPDDQGRSSPLREASGAGGSIPPRPAGSRAAPIAVALLAAVGVSAAWLARPRDTPPSARSPDRVRAVADARPPAQSAIISARIVAVPADATAKLDGARIPLPFEANVERDGQLHRLVVTAPGYVDDVRAIAFGHDIDLTVTLERVRVAAAAHRQSPRAAGGRHRTVESIMAPAPAPTSAQGSGPAATAMRPVREIDREDPYQ